MDPRIVYTDGACSGNPGPGAWAFVIPGSPQTERSGGEIMTTNNRMELMAVIQALDCCAEKDMVIEVRTDSQYVKNGITTWIKNWKRNGWKTSDKKPVKNQELWMRLDGLTQNADVRFVWVEGHAGEIYNERCDELARAQIAVLKA